MCGEHEGDVEGHGRPQLGRQCKDCIRGGACHHKIFKQNQCHPQIFKRKDLKNHAQLFFAWFNEGCYDAEDAREKLAADKQWLPEE